MASKLPEKDSKKPPKKEDEEDVLPQPKTGSPTSFGPVQVRNKKLDNRKSSIEDIAEYNIPMHQKDFQHMTALAKSGKGAQLESLKKQKHLKNIAVIIQYEHRQIEENSKVTQSVSETDKTLVSEADPDLDLQWSIVPSKVQDAQSWTVVNSSPCSLTPKSTASMIPQPKVVENKTPGNTPDSKSGKIVKSISESKSTQPATKSQQTTKSVPPKITDSSASPKLPAVKPAEKPKDQKITPLTKSPTGPELAQTQLSTKSNSLKTVDTTPLSSGAPIKKTPANVVGDEDHTIKSSSETLPLKSEMTMIKTAPKSTGPSENSDAYMAFVPIEELVFCQKMPEIKVHTNCGLTFCGQGASYNLAQRFLDHPTIKVSMLSAIKQTHHLANPKQVSKGEGTKAAEQPLLSKTSTPVKSSPGSLSTNSTVPKKPAISIPDKTADIKSKSTQGSEETKSTDESGRIANSPTSKVIERVGKSSSKSKSPSNSLKSTASASSESSIFSKIDDNLRQFKEKRGKSVKKYAILYLDLNDLITIVKQKRRNRLKTFVNIIPDHELEDRPLKMLEKSKREQYRKLCRTRSVPTLQMFRPKSMLSLRSEPSYPTTQLRRTVSCTEDFFAEFQNETFKSWKMATVKNQRKWSDELALSDLKSQLRKQDMILLKNMMMRKTSSDSSQDSKRMSDASVAALKSAIDRKGQTVVGKVGFSPNIKEYEYTDDDEGKPPTFIQALHHYRKFHKLQEVESSDDLKHHPRHPSKRDPVHQALKVRAVDQHIKQCELLSRKQYLQSAPRAVRKSSEETLSVPKKTVVIPALSQLVSNAARIMIRETGRVEATEEFRFSERLIEKLVSELNALKELPPDAHAALMKEIALNVKSRLDETGKVSRVVVYTKDPPAKDLAFHPIAEFVSHTALYPVTTRTDTMASLTTLPCEVGQSKTMVETHGTSSSQVGTSGQSKQVTVTKTLVTTQSISTVSDGGRSTLDKCTDRSLQPIYLDSRGLYHVEYTDHGVFWYVAYEDCRNKEVQFNTGDRDHVMLHAGPDSNRIIAREYLELGFADIAFTGKPESCEEKKVADMVDPMKSICRAACGEPHALTKKQIAASFGHCQSQTLTPNESTLKQLEATFGSRLILGLQCPDIELSEETVFEKPVAHKVQPITTRSTGQNKSLGKKMKTNQEFAGEKKKFGSSEIKSVTKRDVNSHITTPKKGTKVSIKQPISSATLLGCDIAICYDLTELIDGQSGIAELWSEPPHNATKKVLDSKTTQVQKEACSKIQRYTISKAPPRVFKGVAKQSCATIQTSKVSKFPPPKSIKPISLQPGKRFVSNPQRLDKPFTLPVYRTDTTVTGQSVNLATSVSSTVGVLDSEVLESEKSTVETEIEPTTLASESMASPSSSKKTTIPSSFKTTESRTMSMMTSLKSGTTKLGQSQTMSSVSDKMQSDSSMYKTVSCSVAKSDSKSVLTSTPVAHEVQEFGAEVDHVEAVGAIVKNVGKKTEIIKKLRAVSHLVTQPHKTKKQVIPRSKIYGIANQSATAKNIWEETAIEANIESAESVTCKKSNDWKKRALKMDQIKTKSSLTENQKEESSWMEIETDLKESIRASILDYNRKCQTVKNTYKPPPIRTTALKECLKSDALSRNAIKQEDIVMETIPVWVKENWEPGPYVKLRSTKEELEITRSRSCFNVVSSADSRRPHTCNETMHVKISRSDLYSAFSYYDVTEETQTERDDSKKSRLLNDLMSSYVTSYRSTEPEELTLAASAVNTLADNTSSGGVQQTSTTTSVSGTQARNVVQSKGSRSRIDVINVPAEHTKFRYEKAKHIIGYDGKIMGRTQSEAGTKAIIDSDILTYESGKGGGGQKKSQISNVATQTREQSGRSPLKEERVTQTQHVEEASSDAISVFKTDAVGELDTKRSINIVEHVFRTPSLEAISNVDDSSEDTLHPAANTFVSTIASDVPVSPTAVPYNTTTLIDKENHLPISTVKSDAMHVATLTRIEQSPMQSIKQIQFSSTHEEKTCMKIDNGSDKSQGGLVRMQQTTEHLNMGTESLNHSDAKINRSIAVVEGVWKGQLAGAQQVKREFFAVIQHQKKSKSTQDGQSKSDIGDVIIASRTTKVIKDKSKR